MAGWVVLLALAAVGALGLTRQLSGGGWYVPGSQSCQALAATQAGFVGRGQTTITLVTRDERHTAADPEFATRGADAFAYVTRLPGLHVASAYGWASSEGPQRAPFVGAERAHLGDHAGAGPARRRRPA